MRTNRLRTITAVTGVILAAQTVHAQIDPAPRQILHLGVDAPLNGNGPKGAYAFYYWNIPQILSTNTYLRMAIAPTYIDSELGFKGLLGQNTDLGVGAFGGAFANSYQNVAHGTYQKDESFDGVSGGMSVSVYHLFNPDGRVPLSGIVREVVTYNSWSDTDLTADNFSLPDNQAIFTTRVGFRWGGKEPVLWPTLAMEVSGWYEVDARSDAGSYGFSGDRELNHTPQRLFGRALLRLTTLESKHYIAAGLSGGAAFDSDRLSCFRLGGVLPYTREFALPLPGYYNQEISAQDYGVMFGLYAVPLDSKKSWYVLGTGAAAVVKYEDGMGQPGAFNSGIGAGMGYTAPSRRWKLVSLFGYGFQAERDHGRGGMNMALAFQYNFGQTKIASDEAYDQWSAAAGEGTGVTR